MAKKSKTIVWVVGGAAAAALVIYLVNKKAAVSTGTTTLTYPGSLPTTTGSGSSGTAAAITAGEGLLSQILNLFKTPQSSKVTTPLAQTTTGAGSPAGGINYINPSGSSVTAGSGFDFSNFQDLFGA